MKKQSLFFLASIVSTMALAESQICVVHDLLNGANEPEYKIDVYPKKTSKNVVSKLNVKTNGFEILPGSLYLDYANDGSLRLAMLNPEEPEFKAGQCGRFQDQLAFNFEEGTFSQRMIYVHNPKVKTPCPVPSPPQPKTYDMSCESDGGMDDGPKTPLLPGVSNQAFPIQMTEVVMEAGQKSFENSVFVTAMASNECHVPEAEDLIVHRRESASGRLYYTIYDVSRRVCKAVSKPTPYAIELKNLEFNFTRVGGKFIRVVNNSENTVNDIKAMMNPIKASKMVYTTRVVGFDVTSATNDGSYANTVVSVEGSNLCMLPKAEEMYVLGTSDKKGKLSYTLVNSSERVCAANFDPAIAAYSMPPLLIGSKFTNLDLKVELK